MNGIRGFSGRRTPRVDPEGRLSVVFPDSGKAVPVREIGLGGFSICTVAPVAIGARRSLRLTGEFGAAWFLTATAVYCRPLDGQSRYLSGWAADTPGSAMCLSEAVETLTRSLQFEID